MGCGVSRGNGMALPAKLRPLFTNRFEEMLTPRHNRTGLKETTHSKKNLLQDIDDDDNAFSAALKSMPPSPENSVNGRKKLDDAKGEETEKPKEEAPVKMISKNDKEKSAIENVTDKKEAKIDDAQTDEEMEDEEDNYDDDERMIGYEDDMNFPGSPSFRVYFKDNENEPDDEAKDGVLYEETFERDDAASSKEASVNKKMIKGGRKRRSFKVLHKGGQAAKNLLNVKSCYHSCSSSQDRTLLLAGKTNT